LEANTFFSGKLRVQLLSKLLLNPAMQVYLRGVERDLGVNSNTARIELNKLAKMNLIQVVQSEENAKIKKYAINTGHPMFYSLRGVALKFVGIDAIINQFINKLGTLQRVVLTGELAAGNNAPIIDLILVGDVDRVFLAELVAKAEKKLSKKIRVAVYDPAEFSAELLQGFEHWIDLLDEQ